MYNKINSLFMSIFVSAFISLLFLSSVFAWKIWLEPAEWEFISECPFELDIMMDTEWVESNTVWVSFYIDDTVFALNNLVTENWMFPAYTSFVRSKAWHGDKKWKETISFMWTTAKKSGVKWKWKLATIKVTPLLWVNSMDFEFYAIPWFSADDSNINYLLEDKIADALTEAVWGHYTFVSWECPNYGTPVVISENDQTVLKTSDNENFDLPSDNIINNFVVIIISNIKYIWIGILLIIIFIVLLKKKKEEDNSK